MAILKCKMCGRELNIQDGMTVAECEYCGTKQTVPTADNEKKMTLFARANRLRAACEFDKAGGVYESIVAEFPEEAEAIEDIRKGIIEVSSKEEPYDIFICYKETDENGNRTIDSVIAQDIY